MRLVLSDEVILCAMQARPAGIHTFAIRKTLIWDHSFAETLTNAKLRRRLHRLVAAGKVCIVRQGPGCHTEWAIAEPGASR